MDLKFQPNESYSIGQIQILDVDVASAIRQINNSSDEILQLANSKSNTLSKMGKGAKEISCKEIDAPSGKMLIVELLIDVGNAMGANITNTMCESVSPLIETITGGHSLLRILSNYSTRRIAKAKAVFEKEAVGGEQVVENIIIAFEFADNDVYRAVTHNKGIMNGTISVANAIGQDSRAIEAAANAYAAKSGKYRSLSKWSKDNDGNLDWNIGNSSFCWNCWWYRKCSSLLLKYAQKFLEFHPHKSLHVLWLLLVYLRTIVRLGRLLLREFKKDICVYMPEILLLLQELLNEQIDEIVQKMTRRKEHFT